MSPASSLPSFNLYRGSLLALLVGTAVALWLIVRPPGSGNGGVIIAQVTPTAIVSQGTRTATPSTAAVSTPATPGTPTTETPQATETPGPREYVVQDGDTLIGIATQFAPAGVDPFAYAEQIAAANGIASDSLINPGETLILP
jgi:Tfp pilus assembly protein FimV